MSAYDPKSAVRPPPDALLTAIASYARDFPIESPAAYETARYCLMDTLACGFQALKYPACTKLLAQCERKCRAGDKCALQRRGILTGLFRAIEQDFQEIRGARVS